MSNETAALSTSKPSALEYKARKAANRRRMRVDDAVSALSDVIAKSLREQPETWLDDPKVKIELLKTLSKLATDPKRQTLRLPLPLPGEGQMQVGVKVGGDEPPGVSYNAGWRGGAAREIEEADDETMKLVDRDAENPESFDDEESTGQAMSA